MVRACRPPARERSGSGVARRSTMTTSTWASASSAASIIPVGPPPAITTACLAIRHSFASVACGSDGGQRRIRRLALPNLTVIDQADAELSIRSADGHRARGNGLPEQGSLGGLALLPANAVGQHLRRDEDRSLCQDREVQRIAGPGIHQPHALRAFDLDD